jgi:hypothetical protein
MNARLVLLLCGSLWTSTTHATTVPAYTLEQLQASADLVVDGEVTAAESRWVGQRIVTFVTVVSGTAPRLSSVVVAVLGGEVGGLMQRVPGSPQLDVGRRYRLYLGKADGPEHGGVRARGVFGFFRGVFLLHDGQVVAFGDDGYPVQVTR